MYFHCSKLLNSKVKFDDSIRSHRTCIVCPDEDYSIVVETLAIEEFWWTFAWLELEKLHNHPVHCIYLFIRRECGAHYKALGGVRETLRIIDCIPLASPSCSVHTHITVLALAPTIIIQDSYESRVSAWLELPQGILRSTTYENCFIWFHVTVIHNSDYSAPKSAWTITCEECHHIGGRYADVCWDKDNEQLHTKARCYKQRKLLNLDLSRTVYHSHSNFISLPRPSCLHRFQGSGSLDNYFLGSLLFPLALIKWSTCSMTVLSHSGSGYWYMCIITGKHEKQSSVDELSLTSKQWYQLYYQDFAVLYN